MHAKNLLVQVEPGEEHVLLGSCGDGTLTIWDLRKLGPRMKAVCGCQPSQDV